MRVLKTKIMVTYGPGIADPKVLRGVLRHADIVRFNMSHGDRVQWLAGIKAVRSIAKALGREISIMADLPGPKIRTGRMDADLKVSKGDIVTFVPSRSKKSADCVPVDYPLHNDAKKGCTIDIGDGQLAFHVTAINGDSVVARALSDGVIGSDKGVSLIGAHISASPPTAADVELARFAKSSDFDFIAMSFVKSASNLRELRARTGKINLIAKIEKSEAVANIGSIVREADGVMVARGDLAIEMNIIHIPELQKRIVEAAREAQKPVIVATQLLASMVDSPVPTRAEASDIASAVASSVDCLMLSDETAAGRYPEEAVKFLVEIANAAESQPSQPVQLDSKIKSINLGIAFATASLAERYSTDCIFIPTQTGTSAKIMAALRPNTRLISVAVSQKVARSLSLYRGLESVHIKRYDTTDRMLAFIRQIAKREGMHRYIVISSSPNKPGSLDTMRYIERG
jgi:pyruvate kinase